MTNADLEAIEARLSAIGEALTDRHVVYADTYGEDAVVGAYTPDAADARALEDAKINIAATAGVYVVAVSGKVSGCSTAALDAFLAHAPADLRALLDEVKALRAEQAQIRAALDLDADAPLDEALASIGALVQAWEASNDNVALNAALDADADAHHHEAVVEALIAAGADVDLEAIAVSADPWGDVIDLIASLGGGR